MLLARLFPRRDFRSPTRSLGLAHLPAAHRRRPSRRPHVELLEGRALLTASFGSALSIGNDVGTSQAFDVAADTAGNSYMTGSFSGTVDFDPAATHPGNTDILTARGTNDIFVAKYAPDDSLAWVRRMGGDATPSSLTDTGRKLAIDGGGSVYVVGDFTGSADFGPTTLSTLGDKDGFVAKLDAGGTVQWAKRWGTTARDEGNGVGVDSSGNVYVLGERVGAGINSAQPAVDYDLLKFSPTGAGVWSRSINAQAKGTAAGFAVDGVGNVYVGGGFTGTVDFDPSSKTRNVSVTNVLPGSPDAGFVLKLDTDGKFGWVSPFLGQRGYSCVQSLALDGGGNIIAGGYNNGTVDFNPGSGTTNLTGGGFITKLNSAGGFVWARALENGGPTSVYGLDVDSAGSVYATGTFSGAIDLDGDGTFTRSTASTSLLNPGDIFLVKLTATGNFSWGESFGGTGSDVSFAVAVDPTGTVHLAGCYEGAVDFDPDPLATHSLTNPGTFRNAFLVRLRQV